MLWNIPQSTLIPQATNHLIKIENCNLLILKSHDDFLWLLIEDFP